MTFTIETVGGRDVKGKFLNHIKLDLETKSGLEMARKLRENIIKVMKNHTSFPSGQLEKSIRIIKNGKGVYCVQMPDYSRNVDSGRRFGRPPSVSKNPKLVTWALKAGKNPYALANSIGKRGTHARPFIRESFEVTSKDIHNIIDETIKSNMRGL